MPFPIWNHVADCVVAHIQLTTVMTTDQRQDIWNYIHSLPVRMVMDLFIALGDTLPLHEVFEMDGMEIGSLMSLPSAHTDHIVVILNEMRLILGYDSWLPENSAMTAAATQYLDGMRHTESSVGFLPGVRESICLYFDALCINDDDADSHISTAQVNSGAGGGDDDDDDDTASIASGSTATTIPVNPQHDDLPPLQFC